MIIQTLKFQNLLLSEVISGSKSFGLNMPVSYTDIKGVGDFNNKKRNPYFTFKLNSFSNRLDLMSNA
ncbi:hypothetical protein B0A71_21520 [Flavobacterium tructae]|uniref:Uncharacterized protein n=1 Tax=Flavobacterium tructae TaxID=1114873 RepID=A0ABX4D0Z5_9FLAO|nr:hypothetical protein B0A71_21520 [Flavobacterium tructae]